MTLRILYLLRKVPFRSARQALDSAEPVCHHICALTCIIAIHALLINFILRFVTHGRLNGQVTIAAGVSA